mgnify:FL=1
MGNLRAHIGFSHMGPTGKSVRVIQLTNNGVVVLTTTVSHMADRAMYELAKLYAFVYNTSVEDYNHHCSNIPYPEAK